MAPKAVGKPAAPEWCLVQVQKKDTDEWLESGTVGSGSRGDRDRARCIFNPGCKHFLAHVERIRGHVGCVPGHKAESHITIICAFLRAMR